MAQNDEQRVVSLRDVTAEDLLVFFEQQLDPTAHWMAAFGPVLTDAPEPFLARWERILSDDTRVAKTILWNGQVSGNVTSFTTPGNPAVGYWLGKGVLGKRHCDSRAVGVSGDRHRTAALRPRGAGQRRFACRVLAKCGFVICGEDKGFATARGVETEEYVLRLDCTCARAFPAGASQGSTGGRPTSSPRRSRPCVA